MSTKGKPNPAATFDICQLPYDIKFPNGLWFPGGTTVTTKEKEDAYWNTSGLVFNAYDHSKSFQTLYSSGQYRQAFDNNKPQAARRLFLLLAYYANVGKYVLSFAPKRRVGL